MTDEIGINAEDEPGAFAEGSDEFAGHALQEDAPEAGLIEADEFEAHVFESDAPIADAPLES